MGPLVVQVREFLGFDDQPKWHCPPCRFARHNTCGSAPDGALAGHFDRNRTLRLERSGITGIDARIAIVHADGANARQQ